MEDYTINGECAEGCGKCCTCILPLNEHEIRVIKKTIKRKNIVPSNVGPLDFSMCPFLDGNKRCAIYVHRPAICEAFICNSHITNFNHGDKKIVDMWREFFPTYILHIVEDRAKLLDEKYQKKKKQVFFGRK